MITSLRATTSDDVAGHYDDLDPFYREIWGEHVHHGYWQTGRESPVQAVEKLTSLVVGQLDVAPGECVVDVGCGYGGTSRYLAQHLAVQVTGVTISRAQFDYAVKHSPGDNPRFLLQNWETNTIESSSLDGIVSIECIGHVENKQVFFDQIRRVLRPGRRAAVTAWLVGERPQPWENRFLLEPICREGRLPSMGSRSDYIAQIRQAGLRPIEFRDISKQVKKTWWICARRLGWNLLSRPAYWRFLLSGKSSHSIFVVTLLRLIAAYQTGAMRYGLFVMEKPG